MSDPSPVDYGPLAALIGTWSGDDGMDVAPEPDGEESSPYSETITFEACGDVSNAERQKLAILHYRQIVRRKSTGEVFHDETGYWLWDAAARTVMHSLQIPRAVALIAGGRWDGPDAHGRVVIEVAAACGDPDWGIVQSPFMRDNAKTTAFRHRLVIDGDRMDYEETTSLAIYGRTHEHTDRDTLRRVG